jgi:glycosyltransferase involved in cell wall biosynthesis
MEKRILLNWLPFRNAASGAAVRAVQLHGRLSEEFSIVAAVTGIFPASAAPGVRKRVVAANRSAVLRASEGSRRFWDGIGGFNVWVTDSLPVPRFGAGVKTVITVHDLRHLADRRYLSLQRYMLLRLGMSASLRRADAVVTVSRWSAGILSDRYGVPEGKLHVIPNAAGPLSGCGSPDPAYGRYMLSVGHLEPRKDQATLVRAFADVSRGWDGNLVIAGRGDTRESLEALVEELGIAGRVFFTGEVMDDTLGDLYRGCTCLVCPSVYEGFGMTVLEGLSAGVPVVASDIPPHREVAEGAVTYFPPGDPADLARALNAVLEGGAGSSREEGFRRAARFNWDHSAQMLAGVYRNL